MEVIYNVCISGTSFKNKTNVHITIKELQMLSKFYDLSIRIKLIGGFGIVFLLFTFSALFIYESNNESIEMVQTAEKEVLPQTLNFLEVKRDIEQIQQWLTDISATRAAEGYDDGYAEAEKYYKDAIRRINHSIQEEKKYGGTELVALLEDMMKKLNAYYDMGKKMAKAYVESGPTKGNIIMEEFDPFAERLTSVIDKIVKDHVKELNISFKSINKQSKNTSKVVFISMGLIFIISIFVAMFIGHILTSSLARAVIFANNMAEGNLTQILDINQKDEIGILSTSLNIMSKNLRKMFTDIASGTQNLTTSSIALSTISEYISTSSKETSNTSNTVAAAAEEMSINMNSVAAATEQTSTNIGSVASAVEEMGATINEIANNASKGNEITAQAVKRAEEVSIKVNALGKASREISDITETISDISEQTNLLALNATIEAARAGEAGKGFTVVAGEIKALAQQTAYATTEIKEKVSGIQIITTESINAIKSIVNIINDINEIVTTVSAAVEEQSLTTKEISNNVSQAATGVQEVNVNVNNTSVVAKEVTQNISEVNQAAFEMNSSSQKVNTSSTELSKLAETLDEMVGKFTI
ncbi:MAG: HAMP domain-containing protein [Desulfobacterales bacterium]|nr:HAMP domain-containing protein [Desulfobacterales bacterium]MCP4162001.1 HAMP domain-containing protein [Deltaproteobacteria bacterium]